jgi:hypothetical protein
LKQGSEQVIVSSEYNGFATLQTGASISFKSIFSLSSLTIILHISHM